MTQSPLLVTLADIVEMANRRCQTLGLSARASGGADALGARGTRAPEGPGAHRAGRHFMLDLDATGEMAPLWFEAPKLPEAELARLGLALTWMVDDLLALLGSGRVIEGFTTELGGAYESLDLLGAVGRAMREPQRPREFVTGALRALVEATEFAWAAALFTTDLSTPDLAGGIVGVSDQGELAPELSAALCTLGARMGRAAQAGIVDSKYLAAIGAGPQVVIQPLKREEGLMGLLMAGAKGGNDPTVTSFDTGLVENVAGHVSSFLATAALYAEQRAMFLGTVQALTAAIDAKDRYTCGHSSRVAHLATQLARRAGYDETFVGRVHIAGLVHDVGKIGVPEAILCKTSRLTSEEFEQVKRHPRMGYEILKDIPALREALPGVLHHHERYDGGGYPDGLAGEQIPLQARMLALADTFDAMRSTRSYRPATPQEHTLAEIARCAGSQFDPALAPIFLTLDFGPYERMVVQSAAARAA